MQKNDRKDLSLSISRILARFDASNMEIVVYRHNESYMQSDGAWSVTVRVERGGGKIEANARGNTMEEALLGAWDKFASLTEGSKGAQELMMPVMVQKAIEFNSLEQKDEQN